MWRWGGSPVVDLCDTRGEAAGAIMEVCSLILELGSLCAQDAMCHTRTWASKRRKCLLHGTLQHNCQFSICQMACNGQGSSPIHVISCSLSRYGQPIIFTFCSYKIKHYLCTKVYNMDY